ncbi:hypothetical protein OKA04_23480 [Luteolibacter flavescens]|uniref:Uncharacterized protein n=1 Tax=Luteolibacter flavescens TaxID=1859460 RepID=A0ABT3FWW8_9BACT|nr:hypothetical protein [Luteolibacter flavescens]MCW1887719.1 hypothetical protein [Luteolibacter flavescens]
MDLWDSPVRVMWDPGGVRLVLVPYGAPMWEPVKVDGRQEVQVTAPVRAKGVVNLPRGNESHAIAFALARVKASPLAAVEANFTDALQLPRGKADVLLSFAGGRQFRVKNCAVQSWPHDHEDHVCRQRVSILGGEITLDAGSYVEGPVWGEVPPESLGTEDGEYLVTEDGEIITDES